VYPLKALCQILVHAPAFKDFFPIFLGHILPRAQELQRPRTQFQELAGFLFLFIRATLLGDGVTAQGHGVPDRERAGRHERGHQLPDSATASGGADRAYSAAERSVKGSRRGLLGSSSTVVSRPRRDSSARRTAERTMTPVRMGGERRGAAWRGCDRERRVEGRRRHGQGRRPTPWRRPPVPSCRDGLDDNR
jgi:hypothetical protein